MTAHFRSYVAVDWSSGGRPKSGRDSIWVATRMGDVTDLVNPRTRGAAVDWLIEFLARAPKPVLVGFDFGFGYPEGGAKALTGQAGWRAIWARLAEMITDGDKNENNRFDVAAELNKGSVGQGPFWGNGLKRDIDGLPRKKPAAFGPSLAEHRASEQRFKGTKSMWQLIGAGSVGGQSLMGIASLEKLRGTLGAAIWPFEPWEEADLVFAEIYPSELGSADVGEIPDAWQVKAVARGFQSADRAGVLRASLDETLPDAARTEEGWILSAKGGDL